MTGEKIGLLGGTFDPVHNGHLAIAREARKALGLAKVALVPAGKPMSRPEEIITPAEHRLNMLKLAVRGRPGLTVSSEEIERGGPTFTVDTIADQRRRYGNDTEIYFIMGWDSLEQLPLWREPQKLVKMCVLVAVPRPGYPRPDLAALEKKLPGVAGKVILLGKPQMNISATEIRGKVGRGEDISDMVPAAVADYIQKHRLYKKN